jgi:hypothetical protein
MGLKKRELLEFLDKVESKAVKSVEEKYNKQIKEAKDAIMQKFGLTEKLASMQSTVNTLFMQMQELELAMKDDPVLKYSNYSNIVDGLIGCTGTNVLYDKVVNKCCFSCREIATLKDIKKNEVALVKDNYLKVRTICRSMPNGKRAAEYLKGLGFDLSTLEKNSDTALMTPIDTSKLFVCGENK